MEFCPDPATAHQWCMQQKATGKQLGLVPTMGALHEGHLTLVRSAVAENDLCIASIFVNPLQFNETSDFDAYPRNLEHDCRLLEEHGCNMVFTGTLAGFFDGIDNPEEIPMLDPGPFAAGLEGARRPGHFEGVRTIVERLFATTCPDRAYFGEKDFQQTLVIKDLANQLGYPQIRVMPTQRESNGLAMSSRNQRLSSAETKTASVIYRALRDARAAWQDGERDPSKLQNMMLDRLKTEAIDVEYAEIRDPLNWSSEMPDRLETRAQALIAVRLGEVRLIDNLALDR